MSEIDNLRVKVNERVDKLLTTKFAWLSLNLHGSDIDHLKNIANSIQLTKIYGIQGGSFVQAIIKNDLRAAVNNADSTMIKCIPLLVNINDEYFD